MKEILGRFALAARDAGTAIFFFAGHGFHHGIVNYLVPIDAPIDDENSLENQVSLQFVMASLKGNSGFRILIIDACRDNIAFEKGVGSAEQTPQSVLTKRGFADVEQNEYRDGHMLIAFSALPGHIASDGAGGNSPFTQALLKYLHKPGLELRLLLTRVRAEVATAMHMDQIPTVYDSLIGEFVFKAARR